MKKSELKSSLTTIGVLFIALLLLSSCTKKEAPSAPTNLTAVLNGDCIHLSWKKVPNADYYRITVGFLMRDSFNQLTEVYEVPLAEVSSTIYDDRFPFNGPNFYKIEAVNEYGSSPCSEVSCDYSYHGGGLHLSLYPNPNLGYLCITANNNSRCTVTNLLGDVFFEWELHVGSNTLDMSQLTPGIYLVHAYNEFGEVVQRFVIKGE